MTAIEANSDSAATVREEVRAWLAENWDPEITVGEWWDRLGNSGWAVPTWPNEWFGRGLPNDLGAVVSSELRAAGAIGAPAGLGLMLAGPTIVAHGTEEQKRRYLGPIVTGQEAWCQLFSEPNAGSDLASLQTKATRDGDEWTVNGQKVWTSNAHMADLGMLIARTNPDAPKHKGISYFAIPMDQPGIDVRPLREMTGRALFNEVFLTDARVSDTALIGEEGEGWGAALTTLANERAGLGGGGGAAGGAAPGTKAGELDKRVGDFVKARGGMAAAMSGRSFDLLKGLAQSRGKHADPSIRQSLARLYTLNELLRFSMLRSKAAKAAGQRPGAEANIGKLSVSQITRLSRDVGLAILGPDGMVTGRDAATGGVIQEMAIFSPAPSIYGGTDQVQRNIIGERVLGLPKEASGDKDIPFKDLPRN